MKSMEAIDKVMTPALQQIDQGKKPAADVLKPLAKKLTSLAKGRYPTQEL